MTRVGIRIPQNRSTGLITGLSKKEIRDTQEFGCQKGIEETENGG